MLNKKSFSPLSSIGIAAFCLYIFMTYNAVDLVFPARASQLSMYLFLGVGALGFLLVCAVSRSVNSYHGICC